jgi:hypothetical protein
VNREEIRLAPGASVEGPEKYFTVAVDSISGGEVTGWHIADRSGARSANLGGPGVTNVDLVLGQGRVTGQAILKDVGRAMLVRNYGAHSSAAAAAGFGSIPLGPKIGMILFIFAVFGIAYELGRRRRVRA